MSKSLLSLMKAHPHTWLKVYEGGKEKKIRYEFASRFDGITVIAHHIAEEPNCKNCVANLSKKLPCACTSSYMNNLCMKKSTGWWPGNDAEVFAVLYNLGCFENNFSTFSLKELEEGYHRFVSAFDYDETTEVHKFVQIACEASNKLKYTCDDKIYEFIFSQE